MHARGRETGREGGRGGRRSQKKKEKHNHIRTQQLGRKRTVQTIGKTNNSKRTHCSLVFELASFSVCVGLF